MSRPLMLFAAGFGTRMGALTRDRPKPMIDVAGRPLIDHAIALGRAAGAAPIVANTHYLPHRITPHLEAQGIAVSHEASEILDTGGGLRQALPLLGGGAVFTLNTDMVWAGPNPLDLLEAGWTGAAPALLCVVPVARTTGRRGGGDFDLAPDGRLTPGDGWVYTGAQIMDTALLQTVPDRVFSLSVIWRSLAADGRLCGVPYDGRWADVGHPDGIAAAEQMLADDR